MAENFKDRSYSNENDRFHNNSFSDNDNSENLNEDINTDSLLSGLGKTIENNYNKNSDHVVSEQPKKSATSNSSHANIPAIFEYLPDLIKDMYKAGINFSINSAGEIVVKDFYRPATMKMLMNNDETFYIEIRKDNIPILSLEDLINLNYREWKKTGKAKGNYDAPAKCWSDLFAEKGLVKRQMVFIPTDED